MTHKVEYVAPTSPEHPGYMAATVRFAENFDTSVFPKFCRVEYNNVTIDCTPTSKNKKNETGIKRLRRILAVIGEYEVSMRYGNSVTETEFFKAAA